MHVSRVMETRPEKVRSFAAQGMHTVQAMRATRPYLPGLLASAEELIRALQWELEELWRERDLTPAEAEAKFHVHIRRRRGWPRPDVHHEVVVGIGSQEWTCSDLDLDRAILGAYQLAFDHVAPIRTRRAG